MNPIFEIVYKEWIEFSEEMTHIDELRDEFDWGQLGCVGFPAEKAAKAILRALQDSRVEWRIQGRVQFKRIHILNARFHNCISALLTVGYDDWFKIHPPGHEHSNPYVRVYRVISISRLSLCELQTIARSNYVEKITENKLEMAFAVNKIRRWGFNTFGVRAKLNDDVLTKIKSFL